MLVRRMFLTTVLHVATVLPLAPSITFIPFDIVKEAEFFGFFLQPFSLFLWGSPRPFPAFSFLRFVGAGPKRRRSLYGLFDVWTFGYLNGGGVQLFCVLVRVGPVP